MTQHLKQNSSTLQRNKIISKFVSINQNYHFLKIVESYWVITILEHFKNAYFGPYYMATGNEDLQ